MPNLAINGGDPVRTAPFPEYVTIGEEEKRAVMKVMDSTILSKFLATWSDDFYGGVAVQKLEREWEAYFKVDHAVSMNSATSGLYAAVGAAGVGPGDEVIVSPYTMTASVTGALVYGAVPVFADIDESTFCITPDSIRRCISPYTKAIIVVDLFGHPAEMDQIMEMAQEHGITVIEDAAQAPGATYFGRPVGTLGHMGVFSLNYHKTIHAGEGGIVVTDDPDLADRLQLIRNHAEVVVEDKGTHNIVNMIGFNYRLTEIQAAIASEQLKKLDGLLAKRLEVAEYFTQRLSKLPMITPPLVQDNVRSGFYLYAMKYKLTDGTVSRERFAEAIRAEGVPIATGYVEPIYMQPMYQQRIAFGRDGFPFTYPGYRGSVNYEPGICPVTEKMYFEELMTTNLCHADMTAKDMEDVVKAFEKVANNMDELK